MSDGDNNGLVAGGANQPFYVVLVTCQNHRLVAESDYYNNGVNHICRSSLRQQATCRVRIFLAEGYDHAASQETAQLSLLRGSANLGDDGRGNQRNNAKL